MELEVKNTAIMVRGIYDFQKLRMQMGLRLVGNFRAKLKVPLDASNPEQSSAPSQESNPKDASEIDEEGEKIIDLLRASYRRLTDGVAKNRTLPAEKGFHGDPIINTYSELALVHQYVAVEREEAKQFRMLNTQLEKVPIYNEYLKHVVGIGPAMAGVLIGWLDPYKARHVSSFWKYCGLDVGPDGRGRSRRQEHLVEREYVDKNGEVKTRMSITYEPFLKSKLMGVLAGSFIRTGSSWRRVYDDYKHRINSDPSKIKIAVNEWKKLRKDGVDVSNYWTPGRINDAAKRYMVKMFLMELWIKWRLLEGLPVTEPYSVAKQGRRPHRHPNDNEDRPRP